MPAQYPNQKTGGFWTTLPGVLTGVAALLTALVAVAGLLHAAGIGILNSGPSPGQTAVSTPSQPSLVGNPAGVLTRGRLAMRGGDFANLETGAVGTATLDSDLNVVGGAGGGQINATNYMAPIDGTADKAACVAALSVRHDVYIPFDQLQVGSSVCLDTHDERVAAFQVVKLPAPGTPQLAIDYTVWR